MTYRDWDRAQPQTNYKRQWEASQQALTMALRENRVKDECLEIAMKMLRRYVGLTVFNAQETIDKIEAHLAELEEKAE